MLAPPPTDDTLPDTDRGSAPLLIERELTLNILRGRYAAGSRLPSVRELAAEHGVNPGTIQRVVARLETRGLITPLQGAGLRVNDPELHGDASLLPLWIQATLGTPRAAATLAELLEVRRVLAARLLVRHRDAVLARLPSLHAAVARFASAETVDDRRDADLAFARAVLAATGNRAVQAIFAGVARLLVDVPVVAHAMYGDPAANAASFAAVLAGLVAGDAGAIEAGIATVDAHTVARFEALVPAAPPGDPR